MALDHLCAKQHHILTPPPATVEAVVGTLEEAGPRDTRSPQVQIFTGDR